MTTLTAYSTLAVMGAMPAIADAYRAETGTILQTEFAPTVALVERLQAGAAGDIGILTAGGIDGLIGQGIMAPGSRTDMALSFIGLAVKAGSAKPDIGSTDAFKATLLAAKSIAYSRIGASGIYFAALIERLGIAEAVNAKATIVATGFTAEHVASGSVELAVQQISELKVVSGIDVVGPLPADIQSTGMFSAGLLSTSANAHAARDFLRFITSPVIAPVLQAWGLEQPAR